MWQVENNFSIRIGSNHYINVANLVEYKGESLFTVRRRESDGLLGVDVDIYNAKRERVATIRHGNVVSGDKENYEIRLEPHHYTITEKETGRCVCELKRREAVSGTELDLSLDLYTPSGFHFLATPTQTNVGGINMSNCTFKGGRTGISVQ